MKLITRTFHYMLKTAASLYLCALLTLVSGRAFAQDNSVLPAAANELVHQIMIRMGNGVANVSISFQNISVLPAEVQESVQNAVFNGFRNAGVRLVKPELAQAQVEITFSEDWQQYLWIANIQQASGSKLVMSKVPRPDHIASSHAPTLTVRKSTVWQQEGPVLDFYQENQTLAILEPEEVAIFSNDSGQWRPRYTLAITHQQPWPRDLRGRLQVNHSQLTVFMPGTRCNGSLSSPTLDCRASDDPWQIDGGSTVAFFSSRRNFFTGLLAGNNAGASVVPFFAAATWQTGDSSQWLFSGVDGRTRLYLHDLSAPAAVFTGWGSNIASLHSGCGSGWQALVSSPGDSTRADSIQAFEVSGREAQAVSSSVELSGPVQALWTAGKNSELVNGIMQVPATGMYEAFTLSISCGR